jgi:hypothetical protein
MAAFSVLLINAMFLTTFCVKARPQDPNHTATTTLRKVACSFGDGYVNDFIDGKVICQPIFFKHGKREHRRCIGFETLDLNGRIPPGMSIRGLTKCTSRLLAIGQP